MGWNRVFVGGSFEGVNYVFTTGSNACVDNITVCIVCAEENIVTEQEVEFAVAFCDRECV